MTDTTDIAALSSKIVHQLMDLGCADDGVEERSVAFVSGMISKAVEAERQRADKAEKSNAFLKEQLAKLANFNPDWDMLEACRESWREVVALLKEREAEIAALKAKLANPVVLPAGYSARAGHPFHEGERNVMIPNKHGDWLSRFEVEHAIHVAGFPFTVGGE